MSDNGAARDSKVPVRALSRGIAVLQAINRGGSLTLAEIARQSGVSYATATRLVETLLHEGLIEREATRRRYRPAALVQTLAHGFQGDGRLVTAARPHIVALTRAVGWPVTLSTRVGHSMILRDSTHAITALTFNAYFPGYASPIVSSAAGLVQIAFSSAGERVELVAGLKLIGEPQWSATLSLIEEGELLERIRRQGYATREFNQFTRNPGKTSSIAAPVMDRGKIAGAISLAFFSSAMRMEVALETLVAPLLEAAATIGATLKASQPTVSGRASAARKRRSSSR